MQNLKSYHLHVKGIVQGVGFRPMAYNFAIENNLKGYVCNSATGLHFIFNTTEDNCNNIIDDFIDKAPVLAKINRVYLSEIEFRAYNDFTITESKVNEQTDLALTPDFAMCQNCRTELHDPANRRYRYPFITCTCCGPRYSITRQLPYDRINTAMHSFSMCNDCKKEYNSVTDRRYFSQTNSCASCGITLSAYNSNAEKICTSNEQSLLLIQQYLQEGRIVAVKNTGGFLLLCDATNANAIQQLRKRKHRPSKPFAVLCANSEMAKEVAVVNNKSAALFVNEIAPVLLLIAKENIEEKIAFDEIAPYLKTVGLLLPNSPLLEIISCDFAKPLICTSANISGSPIIYNNEDALQHLSSIADIIVTHDRDILTPQDDSVIRVTPFSATQIINRRSRGLAPNIFIEAAGDNCIAFGALMKSSIAIKQNCNIYVSQFLGDTSMLDSQQMFEQTYNHLLSAIKPTPTVVLADKHPDYFSSQFATTIADKLHIPLYHIQHHKAHFAAVLADNNLIDTNESILGVIWDGTGLGDDGKVWGGEFFKYSNNAMQRCYYFDYFPLLLGDKMAREPRLSALCAAYDVLGAEEFLKEKFTEAEWKLYQSMLAKDTSLQTSSVGRIFDAVASLLGLCDKQSFEGEAAMLLESLAQKYLMTHGLDFNDSYFLQGAHYNRLPTATIFTGVCRDLRKGKSKDFIAAKFHYSMVQCIENIARHTQTKNISFSGGVFQNGLLVDLILHHLSKEFKLYFHNQLPPNDENISFGQLMYWLKNVDNVQGLLSKEQIVEECDANAVDSSNAAGNKKYLQQLK
ncbi:MAG: carbamoyltransferase HypF [Sediminibacterium sp.]